MLQILSTSNETSTGPELVQNGDFSELGSELVQNGDFSEIGSELITNGDFSAAGSNLVTNPNFTDTGSELITNGDFAVSGTLTSTSWSLGWRAGDNGLSISDGALNLVNDGSGFVGRAYATNGVDSYNGVIEVGKSYSLTYEVTENIDAATLYYYAGSFVSIAKDVNVHTVEFTATTDFFLLRNGSSNTTIKIDNVSVKELGADWTAYTSGTSTVEYNSTGANLLIDSAANGGSNVGVYQENIFELGKSYKIVLSMKATASFDAEVVESNLAATENVIGTVSLTTSFQDFTFYYVGTGTFDLFIHRLYNGGGASQTISIQSVSVKELGEGWIDDGTPLKALTFDANGLKITSVNGTGNNNRFYQSTPTTEDDKSYKLTYTIHAASLTGSNKLQYYNGGSYQTLPTAITGTPQTLYFTREGTSDYLNIRLFSLDGSTTDTVTISSISVKEVGQDWTVANTDATHYVEFFGGVGGARYYSLDAGTSALSLQQVAIPVIGYGKSYKLTCTCTFTSGTNIRFYSGSLNVGLLTEGENTLYFVSDNNQNIAFIRNLNALVDVVLTNVTVQQLDPNGYWTIGTGWSIGDTKAISTVTGSNSDITQSILTAGKTYQTIFEVVDYTAGTVQAVVTGDVGADRTAIETYTESLTATGTDFSIRSKLGTFNGSVSSVSVKLLGTYDAQSIYVTAADVQTIPQASVYYLVELTSMASKNSIYFLPSSVVPNNGRYTKLNFTVVSKDALTQPTVGIISFYDSVGGFDTYPMGFYEFKIYEQTSSTNLDPTLATGLLEKGFAFVRDFSGNMQELTDGFKEYNPTLTQYVYSK